MDDDWYYAGADRSAVGPCSRADLDSLRARGDLDDDALVWTRGMDTWMPFSRVGDPPLRADDPPGPVAASSAQAVRASQAPQGAGVAAAAGAVAAVDPVFGTLSPRGFRDAATGKGLPPAIVVDDDGWQYDRPTPWRRYFARMLDSMLLGATIWSVLGMLLAVWGGHWFDVFFKGGNLLATDLVRTILTFALVLPVEAWILGVAGTTPGKWLFGVRVTRADGGAIGFLRALRREGQVFLQGLALGIPLFSVISMIVAYFRLKSEGVAGWDEGRPWVVTGRSPGVGQWLLFSLGVLVWLLALAIVYGAQARHGS